MEKTKKGIQMNQKHKSILEYIFERYTAQEVIEALIQLYPKSIKRQLKVVPKKSNSKHNPYHYSIHLNKITYDEAFIIRKFLYEQGYEENDFEYDTTDY